MRKIALAIAVALTLGFIGSANAEPDIDQILAAAVKACDPGKSTCVAKLEQDEHIKLRDRCASDRRIYTAFTIASGGDNDPVTKLTGTSLDTIQTICGQNLATRESVLRVAYGHLVVAQTAPMQLKSAAEYSAEIKAMREKIWYDPTYTKSRPTTLKAVIAADKDFRGADNPFWKEATGAPGLKEVCVALHSVQVACDYNTRSLLSMFLTVNGKGLFPAAGGTNPYFTAVDREKGSVLADHPDDGFIGQPVQNKMLADAVRRNTRLFKSGDLSVEALKNWR